VRSRADQRVDAAVAFQRRILALARGHDLLTDEDWTGAPLSGVVRAGLAALAMDGARVDLSACEAPGVFLPPGAALTVAMAIHELATNAVRHGALSAPGGRVRVAFLTLGGNEGEAPRNVVEWVERGGPPVPGPPTTRGFGLRLLERGLAMQAGMGADIRFERDGAGGRVPTGVGTHPIGSRIWWLRCTSPCLASARPARRSEMVPSISTMIRALPRIRSRTRDSCSCPLRN
jgi:two-component sensor histidine kinase